MTGYDVYKRVLNISGYLNSGNNALEVQNLSKRICELINQICIDLKIKSIQSLEEKIIASDLQIDALCYGTAMLLAISQSDSEKNQLFSQIYNSKRSTVLSKNEFIEDKLPSVSYGVD